MATDIVRPSRTARRAVAVAETLGYLGGSLGILGLILLAVRSWSDFGLATRLTLSGATTLVFGASGAVANASTSAASSRLRQYLWFAATASFGVVAATIGAQWLDAEDDPRRILVIAGGVFVASTVTWWWRAGLLQHVTALFSALVVVGAASEEAWGTTTAGLVVWAVAGVLALVAALVPVPWRWLTAGIGAIGAVGGALYSSTESTAVGLVIAVATSAALVVAANYLDGMSDRDARLAFAVVGIIGLVQSAPPAIDHFADQAGLNTGLVVGLAGITVLVAAMSDLMVLGRATATAGATIMLVGCAIAGIESPDFATVVGSLLSVFVIGVGLTPTYLSTAFVGIIGLLFFIPWAVIHFFPGDDNVPLAIVVAGALITIGGLAYWRLVDRDARRNERLESVHHVRTSRSGPRT
jgi:hypothetical protein